jgi:hypothetical protein
VEGHHIGVALADDRLSLGHDLGAGPVQPVEHLALAVQRRLLGVAVLGPLARERAPAEAERVALGVEDREHQPVAELVLQLVGLVHEGQAGVDQVVAGEPELLEVVAQPVPPVGCVAQAEAASGVAEEAPRPQVLTSDPGRRVVEEQPVVEVDGGLVHGHQPVAPQALLALVGIVVAQRDREPGGQPLDGLHEAQSLVFLDELDDVAARCAAEAVVQLHVGTHRERRRLLGVERAQALVATADAFQRDVVADHGEDVGLLSHPGDVVVHDAHAGLSVRFGGFGAGRRSRAGTAATRVVSGSRRPRSAAVADPSRAGPPRTGSRTGRSCRRRR